MIRAIIFDCFGVLTTEGWLAFKDSYFGARTELSQQASDLRKQVDTGLLGYNDFVHQITDLAGISSEQFHAEVERNVPNEPLFKYIRERLKPQYKIGLLSNAGGNRLESLFGAERVQLFDEVALSFETGAAKPHLQAYAKIAKSLGFEPAECIFIDDQERYCSGARDAGMHAIWYQNFEQCRSEIEKLLDRS